MVTVSNRRAPMTAPSFCGSCTADAASEYDLAYDADLGVWACMRCRTETVRLGKYGFDDSSHPVRDDAHQPLGQQNWGGGGPHRRRAARK